MTNDTREQPPLSPATGVIEARVQTCSIRTQLAGTGLLAIAETALRAIT